MRPPISIYSRRMEDGAELKLVKCDRLLVVLIVVRRARQGEILPALQSSLNSP